MPQTTILSLPLEVMANILSYLPVKEMIDNKKVHSRFNDAANCYRRAMTHPTITSKPLALAARLAWLTDANADFVQLLARYATHRRRGYLLQPSQRGLLRWVDLYLIRRVDRREQSFHAHMLRLLEVARALVADESDKEICYPVPMDIQALFNCCLPLLGRRGRPAAYRSFDEARAMFDSCMEEYKPWEMPDHMTPLYGLYHYRHSLQQGSRGLADHATTLGALSLPSLPEGSLYSYCVSNGRVQRLAADYIHDLDRNPMIKALIMDDIFIY